MMLRVALALPLLALMIACDRSTVAPADRLSTPVAPSAAIVTTNGASTVGAHTTQGRQDVVVNMQDACDPKTFNSVLGPGTCVRAGGVQFDQFIAELTRLGFIGPWRFAPSTANVRVGQAFAATNNGGELHTFTEVADFGGGIVTGLNELAHVPNVAPECAALESDDFVPPGGTYREEVDRSGHLKFQCCIHPWMRLEASSR
jgi:plastocyanin